MHAGQGCAKGILLFSFTYCILGEEEEQEAIEPSPSIDSEPSLPILLPGT